MRTYRFQLKVVDITALLRVVFCWLRGIDVKAYQFVLVPLSEAHFKILRKGIRSDVILWILRKDETMKQNVMTQILFFDGETEQDA